LLRVPPVASSNRYSSHVAMQKSILALCVIALFIVGTMGESAVASLKAKVEAGEGAAPCDKATPATPAPPRQFLDIRLPVVVDDYHPPVGGFNPSHIPDKEVDVAARLILREIQAAEAEAKANGDAPQKPDDNGVISTEEHTALKQLLLDSDILVRAAAKALAENGPIEAAAVKKVAASAVAKAAKLEKKNKSAPINKLAAATAAPVAAAPAVGVAAPASTVAKTAAASASTKATIRKVGAAAPVAVAKTAAASASEKATIRAPQK